MAVRRLVVDLVVSAAGFPEPFTVEVHQHSSGTATDGVADEAVRLSVHVADGDPERRRPPVVFCHGFPELAYSWRHQLTAVADAGFTAVAPDQRGYGASSRPADIGAYRMDRLCGDLVGILDHLDAERAVLVGHDWGGFVAWAMPVLHPERCAGVVGVCTPYLPFPTTDLLRALFGEDERMYMLWFQEPGVAESVLDPRARMVFEKLLRGGVEPERLEALRSGSDTPIDANPFLHLEALDPIGPQVVEPGEVDHYATVFERTGFAGGINWYRNIDANAAAFPGLGTTPLHLPTLMLSAAWDPALRPELAAGMPELCDDLEMHIVERAGHWVQQEDPATVNRLLVDWLHRRFG